jgi:hypothetical protein
MVKDFEHRASRSRLRIVGAIDDPLQARVNHSPRTHCTRFQRDVHLAFGQAMVAESTGSCPQGNHFRMSRGIAIRQVAIATSAHDAPGTYYYRPYGYLAQAVSVQCLSQRLFP